MTPTQRAIVRSLARQIAGPAETQRLETAIFDDEGLGYDIFGGERESMYCALLLGMLFHSYYFRVCSTGAENVPADGPVIIAPNHSGVLPFDGFMIGVDLWKKLDPPRMLRSMVDFFAYSLPVTGLMLTRIGQIAGTRRNFAELMDRGGLLCVFPEGARGTGKLYRDRYKLGKFNVGHVELSLQYRAPIVPTAVIGAEEQAPMLYNFKPVARLIGLPYFPVTPFFPWLGPFGAIPLPVRYHIRYGAPLRLWEALPEGTSSDPNVVAELAATVRQRVAELISAGLAERKGVFR